MVHLSIISISLIEINVTLCAHYHEVKRRHMDQKARMKYRKDCDEVFPGIILPSANSCRYWGTERRKECPDRSLQHFCIGMQTRKKLFLSTFYVWSNVLDASQATLAMAGARKTERMPGQKLAWPALALVWPQAWFGLSGWPGLGLCGLICLPGSLWPGSAKAALCCLLVLWHASPSLWTGITTPCLHCWLKDVKKSKGMYIFSIDMQQNEIVTQQTTFLTERVPISSFPPQSPDSPAKWKFKGSLESQLCICFVLLWLMDQDIVVESRTFSNKSFPAPLALQCWLDQQEKSMDRSIELVDQQI